MNPFRKLRKRPFRLTVDGVIVDHFVSYAEALAHRPEEFEANWSIGEKVGGRYSNRAFGYQISTADLARMGVPIGPASISEDRL